jgi:tetratricopeptide (TPR) repeat protein
MIEPHAAEVEDEANEIYSLELSINNEEFNQARIALRKILLGAGNTDGGNTIGDALAELCKNAVKHRREAILVTRCLAVQGIVPEPNATNQIVRLVIELCEAAIPDIVSFLKMNPRAQNIEKYLSLADCHSRIEAILDPLRVPYTPIPAHDPAMRHYQQALMLNPRHRSAHEHLGEAYLVQGDLAEEHLTALERICLIPCDEYDDLGRAIAKYKKVAER